VIKSLQGFMVIHLFGYQTPFAKNQAGEAILTQVHQ